MKKIIIIGCPGSGKSTFSKKLHRETGIPLFHLDMIYWNADKTVVEKNVFMERLENIIHKESWIIDGNYESTIDIRLKACDTVFFLDYPVELCIKGIKSRKGKARTDMPWVEKLEEEDDEFITFVKNYNFINKPTIMNLLKNANDKNIIIFKSRKESEEYLSFYLKKDFNKK